ncbi:MAG: hypothetical protein QF464_03570 [Myxococcota bacterium]|jgi:hypothetical protein|nr:hypothetical protein [Myxococcota bacterium]
MMKVLLKLLVIVLVAAGGYAAYLYFLAPEKVYCGQLARLCEVEDPELVTACEDVVIAAVEKDQSAVRDVVGCAVEAQTCSKALGCAMGAGAVIGLRELEKLAPILRKAPGLIEEFMDGLKKGTGDLLD